MYSKARIKAKNRKRFASISGGLLICSFSLLLIIEKNYTDKVAPKAMTQSRKMDHTSKSWSKEWQDCYQRIDATRHTNKYEIEYLEDVMDGKPTTDENIFFHETTCSRSSLVHLNSRQACAIESAARMNPKRDVFVLFASPVGFRNSTVSYLPTNIEVLKSYSNVHLRNNNLWRYVEDTPLESWLSNSTYESKYFHEHMSDVLRYLTLYKFGGIYLDLDLIVQRNFDELGQNFAGDESEIAIGCGVLHFGTDDQLGMGEECIRFLLNHLNDNGSLVLTKTLERLCETKNRASMTREQCKGFQVYPKSTFYAVSRERWKEFFDPSMRNETLRLTKDSTVIQVWNDMSKNIFVKIGEYTAYEVAAKIHCPRVYLTRINYEYF